MSYLIMGRQSFLLKSACSAKTKEMISSSIQTLSFSSEFNMED